MMAPIVITELPSCSSPSISTISNFDSSLAYTFVPDTGGISIDNLGIISGLVIGSNYTVIATIGGCVSASSNTFSFSDQLTSLSLTTSVKLLVCAWRTSPILFISVRNAKIVVIFDSLLTMDSSRSHSKELYTWSSTQESKIQ